MKTRKYIAICLVTAILILAATHLPAQSYTAKTIQNKSDFQWPNGKKMALCLTFDDARLSQPDKGIPML